MNRFIHFGEGLFETFKVEGGKLPKLFEYHYERLKEGAKFFEIPYPPFEVFKGFVENRIRFTKKVTTPFYVKVLLLSLGDPYFGGKSRDYRLNIVVKPFRPPKGPFTLTVSPFRRHSCNPLSRYKTLNYLFNVNVKREALKRGFYDALILNERNHITETSSANFYCLTKDGTLITPPLEEGLLPGITRRHLLETGKAVEGSLALDDLKRCKKFFISNALLGLKEVQLAKELLKED